MSTDNELIMEKMRNALLAVDDPRPGSQSTDIIYLFIYILLTFLDGFLTKSINDRE